MFFVSGEQNVDCDHAVSHLGKAEGLVRLIRGVPHLAHRHSVVLPRNLMVSLAALIQIYVAS